MRVTGQDVPATCSNISRTELRRHRSCVEDGLVLAVFSRCVLIARVEPSIEQNINDARPRRLLGNPEFISKSAECCKYILRFSPQEIGFRLDTYMRPPESNAHNQRSVSFVIV